jgi:hypothetical protein
VIPVFKSPWFAQAPDFPGSGSNPVFWVGKSWRILAESAPKSSYLRREYSANFRANIMSAAGRCWKALLIYTLFSSTAIAQQGWANALLDRQKVDFGVIATGSEAIKTIKVENNLAAAVQISGVSTGCQCASATIVGPRRLEPKQSTTIEVRMNTLAFTRKRETTLTIGFDAPSLTTVQVPIEAYIRTDVVFDPGKLDFGKLDFGKGAEQTVKLTYAGRPDWKIVGVKCPGPSLKCEPKVVARNDPAVNGINVEYALRFQLAADAKPGRFQEYVTIETDDAANPFLPILVLGTVQQDFSISNPQIELKALRPGQTATARVVVKGVRPFVVTDVNCGNLKDCFSVRKGETPEKLQVVDMLFTAPARPGRFKEQMQLKIEGREQSLEFAVSGMILN